ncbi:MAG: hypothetical protein AMJ90_03815 [candidate division Zixibacteria bacterium SM23_73_2]|nr:MAG: hypothetical protein AMJ90_03815 [candidate division Zixibacteria bacterium SM23_73_2]
MEISIANELKRKAIHLGAVVIPLSYYFLFSKHTALCLFVPAAIISVLMDIIRLSRWRPVTKVIRWFLRPILRRHERFDFTGSSYILTAFVLSVIFFDKKIAVAVLCFAIVGDVAAALVGRTFGRVKVNDKKTLEGSLAFFFMCILIVIAIPSFPFWIGALGALVATLMEAVSFPLNDNLTVPLVSGMAMKVLFML